MVNFLNNPLNLSFIWIWANFVLFFLAFGTSLYLNFNFNTVMVGLIYLVPLTPMGLNLENVHRFLMVSYQNTIFGIIELAIFVVTVRKSDLTFDQEHIKQLFGHALPIAIALIGLSFVARTSTILMSFWELILIAGIFLSGSVFRVLAVCQIGSLGFKFDIAFRQKQSLKTDQLYSFFRHPSYLAMMMVILAYALNAHHLGAGVLGIGCAWFGFQYRIVYEEKALEKQFGQEYRDYSSKTGMWFPKMGG